MTGGFSDALTLFGLFAASCAATLLLAWMLSPNEDKRPLLGLIAGLAMLGTVAGYAGGLSRTAVVGDIIPAALALAGGAAAYLFGTDRSKGLIASICAVAFGAALFLGFASGAAKRGTIETWQATVSFCRDWTTDSDILSDDKAWFRAATLYGDLCTQILGAETTVARNLPSGAVAPDDAAALKAGMDRTRAMTRDFLDKALAAP